MKLPIFLIVFSLTVGLTMGFDLENLIRGEIAKYISDRALCLEKQNRCADALKLLDEAVSLAPHSGSLYYQRSTVQYKLGNFECGFTDYETAKNLEPGVNCEWRKAIADAPVVYYHDDTTSRVDHHLNQAIDSLNTHNAKTAIKHCNAALAVRADPLAFQVRGDAKSSLNDLNGAIDDYTKAIKLYPPDYKSWTGRARARWRLKDSNGAIEDFNEAIKLEPAYDWAYFCRGEAKSDADDFKGAIADFDRAIHLNPEYPFSYSERGNAWDRLRSFCKAEQDYRIAMKLCPKDAEFRTDYAIHLYRMKKTDSAIRETSKAIELDPKCTKAYLFRGIFKVGVHDRRGALKDFDEAVKLGPTYRAPLLQRGLLKKLLGDKAGARKDLQEVLKLDPTLNQAKVALAKL